MRFNLTFNSAATSILAVTCLGACQPKPDTVPAKDTSLQDVYLTAEDETVSTNVQVLNEAFTFPDETPRRVWVYLPPDYAQSDTRYPVVYMHDGQNVFSESTSYAGEWGVDETLDTLASQGLHVPIVVAVDHGGESRMRELSPWTNPEFGSAQGDAYLDFLINDVKPHIDKHFRTLPSARDTAIMGSSMGGLMSHYAIVKYPEVFSRAAIFSPSFWFSKQSFTYTETHPLPETHKLYFVVGEKEGKQMTDGMTAMVNLHQAQQHPDEALYSEVVTGQDHNEAFWQTNVEAALRWLDLLGDRNEGTGNAR
ncbi:alpha/beta hydrolase [Alteromonas sp. H39]|uniref:alpha/beta hydrolase n=1 Tax=Alteromonas sp. H39 TaxID=3389876 RepID=UPI0039E0EB0E